MSNVLRYGSWPSPISAATVAGGTLRLQQPSVVDDCIYWVEGRPAEKGRNVLMCDTGQGPRELTPAPFNVRTRALEYGGGAYAVSGDTVYFVHADDQCIYCLPGGGAPTRVTEPGDVRFADLLPDPARGRLLAVRENHAAQPEPVLDLVAIALDSGRITSLVEGSDFFSSPRLSPDGERLAWLTWEHPDMPWDATALWCATLDARGQVMAPESIAGGSRESILQPEWGPDGNLYFASDRTGWWNLYRWQDGDVLPVTAETAEYAHPRWAFGMRSYGVLDDGRLIAARTRDGLWETLEIDPGSGRARILDTGCTSIEHLQAAGSSAVLLGGAAAMPLSVVQYTPAGDHCRRIRAAISEPPPAEVLSRPKPVSFPTADGDTAHGLYYPPHNNGYVGPEGSAPPLLVKCHGGPTGATGSALDLKLQFWTSRGFAVLDVNYRGSTGYGRDYREKLYRRWGLADVADCVAGARYLAERGLADRHRLVISGNSAGGFTVLCALTFHDCFAAGASYYGLGDLSAASADMHKFEARYGDRLVAPWPEAKAEYDARSPLFNIERLDRPVIFFQGLEDPVVLPEQAETMVDALRDKGVPVAYLRFEGEGHGFRQQSTIERTLNAELGFYAAMLGFKPADELPPLTIDNLD